MGPRSMSPRVFVVNKSAGDFSHAMHFTPEPLIYVTTGYVQLSQATFYQMAAVLREFEPDDFLLLSGSATLTAFAVAFLKETRGIESIQTLIYDPRRNEYRPLRINGYIEEFEST